MKTEHMFAHTSARNAKTNRMEVETLIPEYRIEYHLYDLRTRKNLTDRELSKLSGVSKTQINQIEDGKVNPTIRTLCSLSLALGVPPGDLFSILINP